MAATDQREVDGEHTVSPIDLAKDSVAATRRVTLSRAKGLKRNDYETLKILYSVQNDNAFLSPRLSTLGFYSALSCIENK